MAKLLKIKGVTILETVVALVIILIIFSISSTILVNTTISSSSIKKIKGRELLASYSANTKKEKLYFDEEIKEENYILKREVSKYGEGGRLLNIHYSVLGINGMRIDEWRELVLP